MRPVSRGTWALAAAGAVLGGWLGSSGGVASGGSAAGGLLPLALAGGLAFFLGGHAVFGRRGAGPERPAPSTTDVLFGVERREPGPPEAQDAGVVSGDRGAKPGSPGPGTTNAGFTVVRAADGRTVALRPGDVAAVTMERTPGEGWALAIVVRGCGEVRVALADEEAARAVFRELTGADR